MHVTKKNKKFDQKLEILLSEKQICLLLKINNLATIHF